MSHIVAIPCLYYLTIDAEASPLEAQYEAEMMRTAWDSGAPLPDKSLVRPDMAGDILTMASDLSLADDPQAPEYRITFRIASPTGVIDHWTLVGAKEDEVLVNARNRYEAELLGIKKLLAQHPGLDDLAIIITSVRMK